MLLCYDPAYGLDFQSSRTLSLAQGGRGGALLNDTITLNPSLLGFQPIASLSGTMNWPVDNRAFNVSVIDGKNQYVNAGISFTRKPTLDFAHVALAKRVLPWLAFGTSVKRFNSRANALSAKGAAIKGFDGGASATVVFPKNMLPLPLQVGLTVDNIVDKPAHEPYIGPRQYGAGIKTNVYDILLFYGDFVESFSNFSGAHPSYSGGLELSLGNDFFVRGGLFGFREKGWSTGAGWVGPKVGLNYGFQRRTAPTGQFEHAVTMDLFM